MSGRARIARVCPDEGRGARCEGTKCERRSRTRVVAAVALAFAAVVLTGLIGWQSPIVVGAELAAMPMLLCLPVRRAHRATRIVVLGSRRAAAALATELRASGQRLELVGRIGTEERRQGDPQYLGPLSDLCGLIQRHDVDLVLLSGGVPRMRVFEELDRSCQDLPVRVCELSAFYEDHFGHIPLAEINAAWFQCVLHPRYNPSPPRSKRVFDVVVSVVLGLASAPLLIVLALLIRRDGGPALYRQVRIGERGRRFTMLKLRTMRVRPDGDSSWSSANDDRVTRLGAFLRRSHIDELPQLLNVLRGEMSIVGPRPEQPRYVEQLEHSVPFYSRRHRLRPGLTGWAQLHCGYGGSAQGTTWKLSHDLYYLRHRSLALDAQILVRTLTTLVSARQFADLIHRPLVFGPALEELEPEAPVELAPAST
jgi:exopolysaccharide biosynthesis polyprenyl glycosylphosphotransferase